MVDSVNYIRILQVTIMDVTLSCHDFHLKAKLQSKSVEHMLINFAYEHLNSQMKTLKNQVLIDFAILSM